MRNKSFVLPLGAALVATTGAASATGGGADYSTILTGLAVAGGVAAIVGAGAIKAAPGFARWLTNKIATFFR